MIDKAVASDPGMSDEPALVVAFGATANKRRVLSKHATLVGRNRGCDIRVDSPEVSGLHCLISRHPGGLTLRDCDSKSGVIVNGQPVRECELRDGDQLQIGPFSFVVSLPVVPSIGTQGNNESPAEQLAQQLQEQADQTKCLQRHIAGVESERDKLAAQIHQLRADLERATFLAEQASDQSGEEDRYNSLMADHAEQTSLLEQQIKSLHADRDLLHQQVQEALRELAKRDRQPAATSSTDESREEIKALTVQLEEIRSHVATITAERDQLRQSLDSLPQVVSDESAEAFDRASWLEEEIETLAAERNRLKAEMEILRFSSEQSAAEVSTLRAKLTSLEVEFTDFRESADAITRERDQLLREKEESQRSPLVPSEDFSQLAAQRDELQASVDRYQEELNNLFRDQESARHTIETLESEKSVWQHRVTELESELASLKESHEHAVAVPVADHSAEVRALEEQLHLFQERVTGIAEERDRIRAEMADMQSKSVAVDNARVDQLESEMADLVDKLRRVESERVDLQRHLDAEHEQNESRLALLKKQLETERQQMKQLVMQAAAEHDRTRAEMENLRSQLSGFHPPGVPSEQTDHLHHRIAELEAALQSASQGRHDANGNLDPDMAAYEDQLNQFRIELEQAQEELSSRENSLERERQEVHERLKQVELDLSRERASLARERAELERVRREFVSEMEHAERESQVRAKLASVDQLASEMKGKSKETIVVGGSTFSQRLRNLIGRANSGGDKPAGK
ncbi:FHA domain-containing protein [bacterium]|nr:FHA domain-containing protein [bacterium]